MLGWLHQIPTGDLGTWATLRTMRALARAAAVDPVVRQTAADVALGVPGSELPAILGAWVGDRVLFLPDPATAEALHEPGMIVRRLARRGAVALDCDDVAMLSAALGLSVGLAARFVAVGFDSPSSPLRHVWTELAHPRSRRWVAVDPTRPAQSLGVRVTRKVVVDV